MALFTLFPGSGIVRVFNRGPLYWRFHGTGDVVGLEQQAWLTVRHDQQTRGDESTTNSARLICNSLFYFLF